jgi:hypothetical protein
MQYQGKNMANDGASSANPFSRKLSIQEFPLKVQLQNAELLRSLKHTIKMLFFGNRHEEFLHHV